MLLALDPGACAGWALYHEGARTLHKCGVWKRAYEKDWKPLGVGIDRVLAEVPQIWPDTPNDQDIITLSIRLGRYLQWIGCDTIKTVYPVTWKGNVPKKIHHARVWDSLAPIEKAIVKDAGVAIASTDRHNMLDAVALGLYGVGRGVR